MFNRLRTIRANQELENIDSVQSILLRAGCRLESSALLNIQNREKLESEIINIVAAVRGLVDTKQPLAIMHRDLGEITLHIPDNSAALSVVFASDVDEGSIY